MTPEKRLLGGGKEMARAQGTSPRPASERLRELDGAMIAGPWSGSRGEWFKIGLQSQKDSPADALAALRNALPLIADVVEAAEAVPELGEDNYLLMDLRAALTALRAALEEK